MAAKPPKPPEKPVVLSSSTYSTAQELANSSNQCQQKEVVDCRCTNISIMQLFHEMKQKYPTVPDLVVNQCVTDNCHDRENCIDCLERELAEHPNFVQAYPSQVLRNNTNLMCKKPLVPTRPAPQPQISPSSKSKTNLNKVQSKNLMNIKCVQTVTKNISETKPQLSDCISPNVPPQRPTTLNFRQVLTSISPAPPSKTNQGKVLRPVRTAPPPPITKHPLSTTQNCIQTTLIQSPVIFSDSGESEISVNISLSPVSERSRGPSRHVSTISVQPDPRDFNAENPRSFTSVNLTLRKPSANPQSPIDITVRPGLTYSSSSFDARRGYQKSFHITVTDGSETRSSSGIRAPNCYNMSVERAEDDYSTPDQMNKNQPEAPMQNTSNVTTDVRGNSPTTSKYSEAELIQRQRILKQRLIKELDGDRKRLERMQREINILMTPILPSESNQLQSEIETLRCECEKMVQEIECAGQFDCPVTGNEFHSDFYTGQRLPTQKQNKLSDKQSLRCAPTPPNAKLYLKAEQQNCSSPGAASSSNQNCSEDCSNVNNAEDGPSWTCHMCTFRNHHSLKTCEQCVMPRISSGSVQIISNYQSPLSPAIHNNQFFMCNNSRSSDCNDQLIPSA